MVHITYEREIVYLQSLFGKPLISDNPFRSLGFVLDFDRVNDFHSGFQTALAVTYCKLRMIGRDIFLLHSDVSKTFLSD